MVLRNKQHIVSLGMFFQSSTFIKTPPKTTLFEQFVNKSLDNVVSLEESKRVRFW